MDLVAMQCTYILQDTVSIRAQKVTSEARTRREGEEVVPVVPGNG